MSKTTLFLAILSTGLLALGGVATAVAAEDGSSSPSDGRGKAQDRRADLQNRSSEMQNRSDDAKERHERMRDAHDAWQDCKESHRGNASLNESGQRRCMAEKGFFLNATHARREAHAMIGAIAALERQIGRLEVREIALEAKLAGGNLTANQTAAIQERIEKIDAHQERLGDKLEKLKARLEALQEKWQSVRDRVKEARHGDDEDDEDDIEDEDLSSSSSSSSAASSSASSSSEASSSSSSSGSP